MEIREVIQTMKSIKAAGYDGITNEMIKGLYSDNIEVIVKLCKYIYKKRMTQ